VTGRQVAVILGRLLPAGTVTGPHGTGTQNQDYASATALSDGGPGPGELQINLQRQAGGVSDCPSPAKTPGTWCSITHVHGAP
jgi:hypothetical protein